MHRFVSVAVASLIGLTMASAVGAQSITLAGPADQQRIVSMADISALPRESVTVRQHGQDHQFDGVALASVLSLVKAPLGPALRGKELATVVLVTASDGYAAALALAEVDPAMQTKKIILADHMDGAPLPPDRGPFQLIIEGDLRPARAVRMVTSIDLIKANRQADK
jgi:hypothetical protein